MSPAIVTTAADVTCDWLTEALAWGGVAGGGVVESFTAATVGTGQMGENVRFDLQWEQSGRRPHSVVAKFPSTDPTSRATATGGGSYAREVYFYRELANTVGIRTPQCYFADVDPASGDFVLLLEDLAPRVQGDQLSGCSPDAAELVLAELAALQVPRWNDQSLHDIEWLSRRSAATSPLTELYRGLLPGFMAGIGANLSDDASELISRFADRLIPWVAGSSDAHLVVTHGDFRLDNMMFGAIGPTSDPVAVVDWQTPGHGRPSSDLSYFLGAGLLPDTRRASERALVETYHGRLVAAGVEGYSLDDCWDSYRRESFTGIVMAVVASQIVVRTERGDEMFLAMASRHAEQALDLEAESVI